MNTKKEEFLSTLASLKPEEVTELIFRNSKIKPLRTAVVRINKVKTKNT